MHNDEDTKRKYLEDYQGKHKVDLKMKTDHYGCKKKRMSMATNERGVYGYKCEGCKVELLFVEMNRRRFEVKTREKHKHNEAKKEKSLPQHVKILMTKHLEKGKDNSKLSGRPR